MFSLFFEGLAHSLRAILAYSLLWIGATGPTENHFTSTGDQGDNTNFLHSISL